ncbi:MAG: hypothetical protein ACXVP0_10010, partial [Bacteroidia bacterium]
MKHLIHILCFFALASCGSKTTDPAVKPIAVAGEKELSPEEFKKFNVYTGSHKDSLQMTQRGIERWAQDELFYQEAKKKLLPEDLDVEAEIEKYRKELINYKYEVRLIENNLDTAVTKQQIEEYYNSHQENFILKDNIVKVNYFKIPIQSKALDKIKKAIVSANPKDKENLKTLCLQYADNYFMNDSTWLLLEDVKKEIPQLKDLPEYNFYAGRYFEYSDNLDYYYLKIK